MPITHYPYTSPFNAENDFVVVGIATFFELPPPEGFQYSQWQSCTITVTNETNGEKVYQNTNGIYGNNNIGKLPVGMYYKIAYDAHYITYSNASGTPVIVSQTYPKFSFTILTAENQLPLKKWTATDVINRILDLAEPIRKGEKPRFRLQGMNADGIITRFPMTCTGRRSSGNTLIAHMSRKM